MPNRLTVFSPTSAQIYALTLKLILNNSTIVARKIKTFLPTHAPTAS